MSLTDLHAGPQRRFFDALAAGRFELPRCTACDAFHFPPVAMCPACGGTAWRWHVATGRGTVHSTTTVRRKLDAGGDYGVCLIDLDEGPRLMSRVDGMVPTEVRIGMPVVARLQSQAGGSYLSFEPARAEGQHG